MTRTVETFELLYSPEFLPLRTAVLEVDPTEVSMIARLRAKWPAELVSAALEVAAGRAGSRAKYPDRKEVIGDREGIEQATSARVADHKATRFARFSDRPVIDLCCGIGGDCMSLANAHDVLAIDLDPVRAWMCSQNAACETEVSEVEAWLERTSQNSATPNSESLFHLDPARRVEHTGQGTRQRVSRFEGYQPSPDFMTRLIAAYPHGAIKLGPGVDFDVLPWDNAELELITDGGDLVQCVAWFGDLATNPGRRSATMLPNGATLVGDPGRPNAGDGEIDDFVVQTDAALERAQLVSTLADDLDLREITPGLGLLTGSAQPNSPWLTVYRVVEVMPWRVARVREWLRANDGGIVVVKTRGAAVEANRAARDLRGEGSVSYVVFVLRLGSKKVAVITEKCASPSTNR